jgi:hypothetical protein
MQLGAYLWSIVVILGVDVSARVFHRRHGRVNCLEEELVVWLMKASGLDNRNKYSAAAKIVVVKKRTCALQPAQSAEECCEVNRYHFGFPRATKLPPCTQQLTKLLLLSFFWRLPVLTLPAVDPVFQKLVQQKGRI